MRREDMLNSILSQFEKSAKQFCEETQGLFCEISKEYKDAHEQKNLKRCFAKLYYNAFVVKITYTAHGTMKVVNSILGCSVCFEKTEDSFEIPLPLLTDYCDVDITAPMFIPFITNEEGMIQAFSCIGCVLKKLIPCFVHISCNIEYKNRILAAYQDELKSVFQLDDIKSIPNLACYDYFTLRFTSSAFINFMKGNTAKAIAQLNKEKRPTGYEMRLLRSWSAREEHDIPELSAIILNAQVYNEKGVQKVNMKEFGAMLLSWLLMTPVIAALYLGLFFLLVWIEGSQSVYLLGPIYNFPYCIMCGFITAIALSYFTRLKFYKWLHIKDFEKYCEMDSIQNDEGSDKLMKGFLAFVVTIAVIACVLLSKWNLNFMSNGFFDNSDFISLRGKYYAYDEIERVYYKPSRVNDFGETLDFPSYVLVLEDGNEIDLYEHGEFSDYENILLEICRNQGIKVEDSRLQ